MSRPKIAQFTTNGSKTPAFMVDGSAEDHGFCVDWDGQTPGNCDVGECEATDSMGNTGTLAWWPAEKCDAPIIAAWWTDGKFTQAECESLIVRHPEFDAAIVNSLRAIVECEE